MALTAFKTELVEEPRDRILLVDDEPAVLRGLRRILHGRDFEILCANGGAEALELLDQHDVCVIVSDYRMPKMNGAELLWEVRRRHPQVMRLLLTGEADMHSVLDAVNRGAIFKLITKPCENEVLEEVLREACKVHSLAQENRRLTDELSTRNEELKRINTELEQRVAEKVRELAHLANYDAGTGLPNRRLCIDLLGETISKLDKSSNQIGVIALSIDQQGLLAQVQQHNQCEDYVVEIARRATTIANSSGAFRTMSRLADYEFAIVIESRDVLEDAVAICTQMTAGLELPVVLNEARVFASVRAGISVYPGDGENADCMLISARSALRNTSDSAEIKFEFFSHERSAQFKSEQALGLDLRDALATDEFQLHFQPRVRASDGEVVGAEALLRWFNDHRGPIPPSVFIPLLEGTGQIVQVGQWVLGASFKALSEFRQLSRNEFTLSANLSARQLVCDNFIPEIEQQLAQQHIDLQQTTMELEITESLLVDECPSTLRNLQRLSSLGFTLALDDFGTGYSSLNYLTRFPIDVLKIDRSFVANVGANEQAEDLVRAIVSLAHNLGLRVVAEGVETLYQWQFLADLKVEEMQGFYFSPAIAAVDFEPMLRLGPAWKR